MGNEQSEADKSLSNIPMVKGLTDERLDAYLRKYGGPQFEGLESVKVGQTVKGGESGDIKRGTIKFIDGEPLPAIIKGRKEDEPVKNGQLESIREAAFYKDIAPHLNIPMPKIYSSEYDVHGRMLIVMEDLQDYMSADDAFMQVYAGEPHTLFKPIFMSIAKVHAQYWNSPKLAEVDWIGHLAHSKGEDYKESWMKEREQYSILWHECKKSSSSFWSIYKLDPLVIEVIDAMFAKTNWNEYLEMKQNQNFTLVHGDFHGDQIMWNQKNSFMKLIDWEAVKVSNGAEDLGVFAITSAAAEQPWSAFQLLLKAYHETLIESGVKDYPYDLLLKDFVEGGVGKGAYYVMIGLQLGITGGSQWLADNYANFLKQHNVTAQNVGMFRFFYS